MNITEHLINYRFYFANIERLEESIRILRLQQDGQKGIDYSADQRSSNEVSRMVENTVINIIEKENELERQKLLVESIDRAIEELEETDRQIIKLRYIAEGSFCQTWYDIAAEVGFNKRHCIRRKNEALKKVAIVLSGIA